MQKRKMPRNANQRAKLIVDMVHGDADPEPGQTMDPAAVECGRARGRQCTSREADPGRAGRQRPQGRSGSLGLVDRRTPQ